MFIGMTGGVGLPGDIKLNDNEVISDISPEVEAALNHLTHQRSTPWNWMRCRTSSLTTITSSMRLRITSMPTMPTAHIPSGKTLHRVNLTETTGYPGGFEKCKENLQKQSCRRLNVVLAMDMCTIYDVLDYASFGIEKLAAPYPVLKVTPDLDPKHPIHVSERFNVNIHDCPDVEDMRFEISIAIDMAKLENNGISGINKAWFVNSGSARISS